MDYFKKVRKEQFSEVKDFTSSMDHLRFAHPSELSFTDWFWYSPSAHKLVNLGLWINAFLTFVIAGVICISYGYVVIGAFLILFSIIFLASFFKKWLSRKSWEMLSFYDVYIRDFGEGDKE